MKITFLQDYNGIIAGREFTTDSSSDGDIRWSNVTEDGTMQFLAFNAHKLAEQGIVSIG